MFKYIIIVSFLTLPLLSIAQTESRNQVDSKGEKTGYWLVLDEDGNKKYEGNFKNGHPIDSLKRYYPDGTIKAIMVYNQEGKDVLAEIFDEDGKLRAKGNYIDRKKNGKWLFYGTQENLMTEVEYLADQLNGLSIRFFANGDIMEKTSWAMDTLHGIRETYQEGGSRTSLFGYNKGKLNGSYLIFYPDGRQAVTGEYKMNEKEGDWIYYLQNGEVDYTLSYAKGVITNQDVMDKRQKDIFDHYEKVKGKIKDPLKYLYDPETYFRR